MNSFQDSAFSNCLANAANGYFHGGGLPSPDQLGPGVCPEGAGWSGGLLLRFWQGRESEGNKHQQLVGKPQAPQLVGTPTQKPHVSFLAVFSGVSNNDLFRETKSFSKALVKGWKGQGLRQDMSREDMLQVIR